MTVRDGEVEINQRRGSGCCSIKCKRFIYRCHRYIAYSVCVIYKPVIMIISYPIP